MKKNNNPAPEKTVEAPAAAGPAEQKPLQGRSIFVIETVSVGVSVRTALLTEEEKLLQLPAFFPNLTYALNQIDQLRANVIQHFERAAQVGTQVIAGQARQQAGAQKEGAESSATQEAVAESAKA